MRVRVIDVEGSPEELARLPELQELLGSRQETGSADTESTDQDSDERNLLPKQLRDFIASRGGGRARAKMVERFVADVIAWGTTEAEIGTSQTSADGMGPYLRLYRKGPRNFGAFAYVAPNRAKLTFRLLATDVKGYKHVSTRNVKAGTGYEVVVSLTSEEAYLEAIQLAKKSLVGVSTSA